MVPRLARFVRRGPRPRTPDDDDWGTSSPPLEFPMDLEPAPRLDAGAKQQSVVEKLKAQELNSYTCTFSPRLVISLYFVIGVVFFPLGASLVAGTAKIRETGPLRYDNVEECDVGDVWMEDMDKKCQLKFEVDRRIPAPSYLYYTMTNYHQNARKYAKSRSDHMNMGLVPNVMFDVETCEPWLFKDDPDERESGFDAANFRYPCGLTARSFFNDSYTLCKDQSCKQPVSVSEDRISWYTDRKHKFVKGEDSLFDFKNPELGNRTANELLEDEHFVVWMRLSAFPNFMKLYAIIQEPLEAGTTYYINVESRYPVASFGGSKSLHITTTQWFGNSNTFLGTSYLVVGFISLFIATTLLVKHLLHPRPPADSDPTIIMQELAKLSADYRTGRPES